MKKQFQILSFAIAIIFFSCGKHNAEVAGKIPTGTKEHSTNSSSPSNEADFLLIDIEGQLRFNGDQGDQTTKLQNSSSARTETSYLINRSGLEKTIIQLNEFSLVN